MNKKVIILIAIVGAVLILTVGLYSTDLEWNQGNTTLWVYADGEPLSVSTRTSEIETHPYFEGYNKTTLQWFKSQKGVVLSSEDAYVVMSQSDASKLSLESATDVSIKDIFTCDVKEKRPLGNDLKDVIVVDNVHFESQKIEYLDV